MKLILLALYAVSAAAPAALAQISIKASDITVAVRELNPKGPATPIPGWFLAGLNPRGYLLALDDDVRHGGTRSASMRCRSASCEDFGTVMQTIRADDYRGMRVRLTAWVRSENAGRANLWMRVDGFASRMGDASYGRPQSATLDFDNMENRKMRGTHDWTLQQIVLDVPKFASTVNYGLILSGAGAAWIDDIVLEVVDKKAKRTGLFPVRYGPKPSPEELSRLNRYSTQPQNLGFEQ